VPVEHSKQRFIQKLLERCPPDKSYVEWRIGAAQLPQAMISYSWQMPWEILISFLENNIGDSGCVWLDVLACNQHAIKKGDMEEIKQIPSVIEFAGQTYCMPGTLKRLWCIFEMAYSLLFNSRIVYYNEGDSHLQLHVYYNERS
jgi:hypothetical protein